MVQTDASVGKILAALESKGFSDNTWVIFSSDNGPETYAYARLKNYGHRSMGPLRGVKRDLYEGGHRVPMLMRWPGKIPSDRVCDGLMSQIDLFATIAGLLEIEIPEGNAEDSLDQRRMVFGTGESSRETLVHNTNPKGYAIRQGVWLLIESDTGSVSKVPEWFDRENGYRHDQMPGELYRLDVDLGQRENLYGLHADLNGDLRGGKVQAMHQELERIRNAKR
jgi:arylsulfatase A